MRQIRRLLGVLFGAAFLLALFILLDRLFPIDLDKSKECSALVKAADGRWLYVQLSPDEQWRFRVDVDRVDPLYLKMLLAFEDQRFWRHFGVDPLAMLRAFAQLLINGRIVSGGSTITMQLARLLEPKPRTIKSKLIEIFRALELEWHYSKKQILSSYLTLTPYGGNIVGLEAASRRYFGKSSSALSPAEAALLIALPQSPERTRPDRHPKEALRARNKVLAIAKERGVIDEKLYQEALKTPLPKKLFAYPRYAPHLSEKLLKRYPKSKEISTTIDLILQRQVQRWAKDKGASLGKGVTLAALIIRNSDGAILAYLGTHDRFSSSVEGYVDMIEALRSPGSTLKPFIYAMAFQKRLIAPATLIVDRPSRFFDYMPHNFSNRFSGEVTIADALRRSLNIPAVKVLKRLGVKEFIERLSAVAGKLKIPQKRATLPVALGGLGLKMPQLAQLYLSLANDGQSYPIHALKDSSLPKKMLPRLCDREAARVTTAILRTIPPPRGFLEDRDQIAYKTGTSYGYRDAWTLAYDARYTLLVWVGSPKNTPQLKRTGLNTAAPLAFELFSMLHTLKGRSLWSWSSDRYLASKAPEGLVRFDRARAVEGANPLSFLTPRENTRFKSADCGETLVTFKVQNGKAPYYWYIDGIAKKIHRNQALIPFQYGAHSVTVIDSNGDTITRNIWVDKPEC